MDSLRITMTTGSPDHDEAAAIVAAIEQFIAETTPAAPEGPQMTGWQRTALLEGTGAKTPPGTPWGEPRGWGALRT